MLDNMGWGWASIFMLLLSMPLFAMLVSLLVILTVMSVLVPIILLVGIIVVILSPCWLIVASFLGLSVPISCVCTGCCLRWIEREWEANQVVDCVSFVEYLCNGMYNLCGCPCFKQKSRCAV